MHHPYKAKKTNKISDFTFNECDPKLVWDEASTMSYMAIEKYVNDKELLAKVEETSTTSFSRQCLTISGIKPLTNIEQKFINFLEDAKGLHMIFGGYLISYDNIIDDEKHKLYKTRYGDIQRFAIDAFIKKLTEYNILAY